MNEYSKETLRRVEENDDTIIELGICNNDGVVLCTKGRYFTAGDIVEKTILNLVEASRGILI